MKKIASLSLLLLLACSHNVSAREPKVFLKEFLQQTQKGKVDQAYDNLFRASPNKPHSLDFLKRQTKSIQSIYGTMKDAYLLTEEKMGGSTWRYVYVMEPDGYTKIVWEFILYRPKEQWLLSYINITFQHGMDHVVQ